MPIIDVLIDCCNTPGAKLGTVIGTKCILILMLIFHSSSLIILLKAKSFYLLLLSLSLLGIGSGVSGLTYLRNAWKFFPNNQGLIYGIILSSSGIFSTLLVVLADFVIINPNKENTINGIYPKYVADNVYKYTQIYSNNNENLKLKAVFFSKLNFKLFLFCFCGLCKYYFF